MLQYLSTLRKEFLVLTRDRSGLAILFLMPMALVVLMALIQDAPFRDYQELRIPLALINHDKGHLGRRIEQGLADSKIFEVTPYGGSESEARGAVENSTYEIGIIIPADASGKLDRRVDLFVEETMRAMGLEDTAASVKDTSNTEAVIEVFFAPDVKKSFRNSVLSSIRHVSSRLEVQTMLSAFREVVNQEQQDSAQADFREFIRFSESDANGQETAGAGLNSVQHNVPAWTLFGMFFIVISLAGSMIRERNEGSYLRIQVMPGSYLTVMAGKITTYLGVCLVQCLLMIGTGIFLLPLFGLPQLVIGNNVAAIGVAAVCSGLAATGFGVLVGTIFSTHQQASTFGAVSVVILAALGGIWVPVYVMPEMVRALAELSPLYWGLNAFQTVFLSSGTVASISGYVVKLLLFFAITLSIAYSIDRYKNHGA
jgi:ABC-2 type transport system permease protein